ncbi:MAG: caspase family protein [Nitrospirae bacterium]|nr:caspase family protein [Nitrospirota bacterium]
MLRIVVAMFFTVLLCSSSAFAEKHAVLIGINDYLTVQPLYGPVNDVQYFKNILVKEYGFAAKNIRTLINSEATKGNIMQCLRNLTKTTQKGDFIFIYFSGHGTSHSDAKKNYLPIGNGTGAIVPYDVVIDANNPEKVISSLIVGKYDLRPIIGELDKDRRLFVVFDSCFSGNAVREFRQTEGMVGIDKFINIAGVTDAKSPQWSGSKDPPYPYRNTIFISAADETTKAKDLPGRKTTDGIAHGALTNAIIKGFKDNMATYEELYRYVKEDTTRHGHTPKLLNPKAMDINTPVFERRVTANRPQWPGVVLSGGDLKVKLELRDGKSRSSNLAESVVSVKGVKLVKQEKDYDLLIADDKGPYILYLPNGDKLYVAANVEDVVKRVERYARVCELLALLSTEHRFNVFLKVGATDRSVLKDGETLDFTIKSEEDVSVVLLNVDADGFVTVLLPKANAESSHNHLLKGIPRAFKELGRIKEPFGSEFIKVFAFKGKADGFDRFADKTMDPSSEDFIALFNLIKGRTDWTETKSQIVTIQ